MEELRAALKGVPVYAALGNNDTDCGDYQLDAEQQVSGGDRKDVDGRCSGGRAGGGVANVRGRRVLQREAARAARAYAALVLDDLFMSWRYETCARQVNPASVGVADGVAGAATGRGEAQGREGVGDGAHSAGRECVCDGDEGDGCVQRRKAADVFGSRRRCRRRWLRMAM